MSERRATAALDAHLWALRAEVEHQLRRMTAIHRELNTLPPIGSSNRNAELDRLRADVEALIEANLVIRTLGVSVLHEVNALAGNAEARPQEN